jgi:DNA repair exonuclease SbcCD ATPase subunit
MCDRTERIATIMAASLAASVLVPGLAVPDFAYAQAAPAGRIVCWKDKAGKVVGCGDKVPPEYQDAGTREMDRRGVTRAQTESTEEARRRTEKEQESHKARAEEEKKALEQRRQDQALLATFSNEKEIDLKRDRDLAAIDQQIEQLTSALKNTTTRHGELSATAATLEKNKKSLPTASKDELSRVTTEKDRLEQALQAKQKEKEATRVKYAEYRARYTQLRSGPAPSTSTASTKK